MVTVIVPYQTNLVNLTNLVPEIVHTGASISPESGVWQNFSDSRNTPIEYTVTAEYGGKRVYYITVIKNAISGSLSYTNIDTTYGDGGTSSVVWSVEPEGGDIVTYSIEPVAGGAMPSGISIDEKTGEITVSGEAVVQVKTGYVVTVTATGNYTEETTGSISITVNAKEISGNLSYAPIVIDRGNVANSQAMWAGGDTNRTVTYSISPVETGITVNSETGIVIVSSTAVVQDTTEYTVTATGTVNYASTTTASISITVNTPSMTGSLSYEPVDTTFGTEASVGPVVEGLPSGTISYSITPAILQDGMTFDTGTGEVSLSDTADAQTATEYIVSLSVAGYTGKKTAPMTIAVNTKAIDGTLTYQDISSVYGDGGTSSTSWNGVVDLNQTVRYSIAPNTIGTISDGITINDTGVITVGTGVAVSSSGNYTVTATGTGNYTAIKKATVQITINKLPIEGSFIYPTIIAGADKTSTVDLTWTGENTDATVSYTINPAPPTRITLNPDTGLITIRDADIAPAVMLEAAYTVTATGIGNYSGTKTTTVNITIDGYVPRTKAELIAAIDIEIGIQGDTANLNMINTEFITDMSEVFAGQYGNPSTFNGIISDWDVSSVTNSNMFQYAPAFNSDISLWNVSSVTDMSRMFQAAHAFNSDLSEWTVSSVTDMRSMFYDAKAFNQNLEKWGPKLLADVDKTDMFLNSGMATNPGWYP